MIYKNYKNGIRISGYIYRGMKRRVGVRDVITKFSEASKKRLQWIETQGDWNSMLTLTYHSEEPYMNPCGDFDYKISKCHLNIWLNHLRYLNIKYLWAAEFQLRGVVHYHVLMDKRFEDVDLWEDSGKNSWRDLMKYWLKITGQDKDEKAVEFSMHRNSYIDWEVRGNGYLSKYMGKNKQKVLPEGVKSFGRWWGCSQGLILEKEKYEIIENIENKDEWFDNVKNWNMFRRQVKKYIERKYNYRFGKDKIKSCRGIRWIMDGEKVKDIDKLYKYYLGKKGVLCVGEEKKKMEVMGCSELIDFIKKIKSTSNEVLV